MAQIYDIYKEEKNYIRNNEAFFKLLYTHYTSNYATKGRAHGWLMLNIYSNLYMSVREKG